MENKIMDRLEKQLQFIITADGAKNIFRRTTLADGSRRENDAEHSWHLALMAMLLEEYAGEAGVDIGRVMKMAIIHDLVEIYAGDTFAYDEVGNATKAQRENEAADKLFGSLPEEQGKELRELWEEFDAMETKDAAFAAGLDRLQPLLNNYMTKGASWARDQVDSSKVFKRVEILKRSAPQLWKAAEFIINDSIEKGYLKK